MLKWLNQKKTIVADPNGFHTAFGFSRNADGGLRLCGQSLVVAWRVAIGDRADVTPILLDRDLLTCEVVRIRDDENRWLAVEDGRLFHVGDREASDLDGFTWRRPASVKKNPWRR